MLKCFKGFNKIKSNPNFGFFYLPTTPESPSLCNIEKKIKNFEYKTIQEFNNDLRTLWNYQFRIHSKEPKIYPNIFSLSFLSEEICQELLSKEIDNDECKKEDFINIRKRARKIKKDLEKINESITDAKQKVNIEKIYKKKTMEEINHLGSLIRTLNKQQLKGIIPILSDKKRNNEKFIEFDIDQLSPNQFLNLEKYVFNCININNNKKK